MKDKDRFMSDPQPKNPMHGVTLEEIVNSLVEQYGWEELGKRINFRCFKSDPSVKSSLKIIVPPQLSPRSSSWLSTFEWQASIAIILGAPSGNDGSTSSGDFKKPKCQTLISMGTWHLSQAQAWELAVRRQLDFRKLAPTSV